MKYDSLAYLLYLLLKSDGPFGWAKVNPDPWPGPEQERWPASSLRPLPPRQMAIRAKTRRMRSWN